MKATEQYFPVVLFIMLYKVDCSQSPIFPCDQSRLIASSSQPPFLFFMASESWGECKNHAGTGVGTRRTYGKIGDCEQSMYKVVLSFESVDETLKCDHSNKSY